MPELVLEDRTLHYVDRGAHADVLLLLHAFPLHSGMWSGEVAQMSATHRVIAPDARGLGKSRPAPDALTMDRVADDVLAILDTLGVERAVVGGLSMGGYAALALHRKRPGLFRALILADTRAGADSEEAAKGRERFAVNALKNGVDWVANEMLPKLLRPGSDPRVVEQVRALIRANAPEGIAAAQRGMALRPDSTADLGNIKCPTLVVVGADDTLTPQPESEKLALGIAGSRLEILPNAGHLSNLDSPAAFDAVLARFLSELPAVSELRLTR